MADLRIVSPGLMMTVQDLGRTGLLSNGVSGSGAMDPEALQIANALVGNAPGAAALEFAHMGGSFTATAECLVAVCAAAPGLSIAGKPAAPWQSHRLRAGETVTVGATPGTVWGYVAVSGGIATPAVLGSRATHLRSGIGGLDGRSLQAGDVLPLGTPGDLRPRRLRNPWRVRSGAIDVVMGPQADAFTPEMQRRFLSATFTVSAKRDRMAMILDGPAIEAAAGHDIVSDGTLRGSVQVPGSGHPMVLMADRQTTGGYPKIATVVSTDLARLAQLATGQRFRFRALSQERAEDKAIAARRALTDALAEIAREEPMTA